MLEVFTLSINIVPITSKINTVIFTIMRLLGIHKNIDKRPNDHIIKIENIFAFKGIPLPE